MIHVAIPRAENGPSLTWHVAMERARYYAVTDGRRYQVFGRRHHTLGWVYMVRKI
jgi:hypothetical protein